MLSFSFERALALSARLLAASCAAVLVAPSMGCSRCTDYDDVVKFVAETSPTDATLRAAAPGEDWPVIAVGDGGTIVVRVSDGWSALDSGVTADLFAVRAFAGVALAAGAGGTLVRMESGGAWTAIDTGVTADLFGLWFVSETEVIAVGDGVILRSDDAGATWIPIDVQGGAGVLRAIGGVESGGTAMLTVGDGGRALRSDDLGLTWTAIDVGTTVDLRAVNAGRVLTADDTVLIELDGAWMADVSVGPPGSRALSGSWIVGDAGAVHGVGNSAFDGSASSEGVAPGSPDLLAVVDLETEAVVVGEGGSIFTVTTQSVETGSHLCSGTAIAGRPFVVEGSERVAEVVVRDDWADEVSPSDVSPKTRERLAAAWAREAAFEHASVASFARFALQLLAVGAPPDLVIAAQEAMADEVRHAQVCYGLASAYAGRPVGPGPLAIDGSLAGPSDLAALAEATAREGCVGETIAALIVGTTAALAEDPALRSRLEQIAADERRHAALAWRTVAWALARGGAPVRTRLSRVFAAPPVFPADDGEEGLEALGHLAAESRAAVARAAWREVIAPQAAALLAGRREAGLAATVPATRSLS